MSKIQILIADDEPLARGYLRSLLAQEEDCTIVAEVGDARATIEAIGEYEPDLVFLDVQMPGRDGFSVIEAIGSDSMPYTVFVTAFDQYAIPAFDRHAVDYLLKPFSKERFQAALERVRHQLALKRDAAWSHKLRGMLDAVMDETATQQTSATTAGQVPTKSDTSRSESQWLERLPIKVGGRVILLKVDEIEWIEAADCYVNLHRGRDTYLLRETMTMLEEKLNPSRFIRIHRGSIVNMEFVTEIRTRSSGDYQVILADGVGLPLSRRRKKDVENLIGRSF